MRIAAYIVAASLLILCVTGCPLSPPGETVYFLVANPDAPEKGSYVLPLEDAEDIDHARAVIADPAGSTGHIVVASIARGGRDLPYQNRDLINGGTLWSWRVEEFQGFADATIEILDGWPQYVEDNLDDWMANTGGQIGFWNARVIREVSVEEMAGP